jgi:hypothetical protein
VRVVSSGHTRLSPRATQLAVALVFSFVCTRKAREGVCVLPLFAAVVTGDILPSTTSVNLDVVARDVVTAAVGAFCAAVVDVFLVRVHSSLQ